MTDLDTVWEELFPAEQQRVAEVLIESVVVTTAETVLTLRMEAAQTVVKELGADVAGKVPDNDAWERLEAYRLGRTAVITDRDDWSVERIVSSLREQSHVEFAFRQLKDPQWASAVPLRHYTDSLLRVHAMLSVLALLLAKLVVRRLKRAGVQTTVSEALHELSELRLAQLHYGPKAPPALKELARFRRVPPNASALQANMIRALGIGEALQLGPTGRRRANGKNAEIPTLD